MALQEVKTVLPKGRRVVFATTGDTLTNCMLKVPKATTNSKCEEEILPCLTYVSLTRFSQNFSSSSAAAAS